MTARYAVHWVTAFLDRPADQFESMATFWTAATGTTLSARRGQHDEFATLLPSEGDATLKLQGVGNASHGGHADFEVTDLGAARDRALELGALVVADLDTLQVLRSPAGLPFCLVPVRCEGVRPAVADTPGGRIIADQVALDLGPDDFENEADFWSGLTGWQLVVAFRREFIVLAPGRRPSIRFLLQRLGEQPPGGPRVHLDLACSDRAAAAAYHRTLGARAVAEHDFWTVMSDPSGAAYCLTGRLPQTGRLPKTG
jgi:hypothetical protein